MLTTIKDAIKGHRAEERAEDQRRIAAKDAVDAAFRQQMTDFIRQQAELNRKRDIELAEMRTAIKLSP